MPRALLAPFSAQVGRMTPRSSEHCCFHNGCLGQGGHGCLNLLAPAIMGGTGGTGGTGGGGGGGGGGGDEPAAMAGADVASFAASGRLDFCWPPMRRKVSEWNLNYHVPQCADLPGAKPGSVWRCRLPELSTGRKYTPEGDADLTAHAAGGKRGKRKPV